MDRPHARTIAVARGQVHIGAGQSGAGDRGALGGRGRQRGLELGECAGAGGEVGEHPAEGPVERARRGDGLRVLGPVDAHLGIGGHVGAGRQHRDATIDRGRLEGTERADEEAGAVADGQPAGGAAQPDRAADQQADRRLVELGRRRRRDRVRAEPEVTADRHRPDRRPRAELARVAGQHREAVGGVERVGRVQDGGDRERRCARGRGRVTRGRRRGRVDGVHGRSVRVRRAGRRAGRRRWVGAARRGLGRARGSTTSRRQGSSSARPRSSSSGRPRPPRRCCRAG